LAANDIFAFDLPGPTAKQTLDAVDEIMAELGSAAA